MHIYFVVLSGSLRIFEVPAICVGDKFNIFNRRFDGIRSCGTLNDLCLVDQCFVFAECKFKLVIVPFLFLKSIQKRKTLSCRVPAPLVPEYLDQELTKKKQLGD